MTDEYTPTIETVREGFQRGDERVLPGEDKFWQAFNRRGLEFDRVLAAHDAEVRNATIEECAVALGGVIHPNANRCPVCGVVARLRALKEGTADV